MWPWTRDKWFAAASWEFQRIEHVVCQDFGTTAPEVGNGSRLVWNYGTKCSVDATNTAAQCAVGKVLVVISDDIFPCPRWDAELAAIPQLWSDNPCVVRVSTGGVADKSGLLTVQILNRARYEQIGYLFHPAYVSMYSDQEFTDHAERDGVVVDARHITFYHDHPTTPGSSARSDEVYERQNDPRRYQYGAGLLRYRQERGFPRHVPDELMAARLNV